MSDPTLSDIDFKNKMALVWTTLKGETVPMSMHFSILDSIVSEAASVSLEFIITIVCRLRLYLMLGFNNGYKWGSVNESKHK